MACDGGSRWLAEVELDEEEQAVCAQRHVCSISILLGAPRLAFCLSLLTLQHMHARPHDARDELGMRAHLVEAEVGDVDVEAEQAERARHPGAGELRRPDGERAENGKLVVVGIARVVEGEEGV